MAGELPKEFFTLQSMLTLSGATGATFVVANGIQRALNVNPRWLGLAAAEIICVGGAYFSGGVASDYFVAVVNGFLVFCTAAGATGVAGVAAGVGGADGAIARSNVNVSGNVAASPKAAGAEVAGTKPRRSFLTSWF